MTRTAGPHDDRTSGLRVIGGASPRRPVQERANAAGFAGIASETLAINPALATSGIEIMNDWYDRPKYMAIMSNRANAQIGVWSENSLDRTIVVAVHGQPAGR